MPDMPESPASFAHIHRLPEHVINRIAAGEVVARPSSALKELLENSLDAGATVISVAARDGGLKSLQVTDNGTGISHQDLPLLCQRFATSKISTYEDLASVQTFGFRGEALASMSSVARLSVLTKTSGDTVAYKAVYTDTALKTVTPVAGVQGTTITIEDLFFNLPTRRTALATSSDEYRRVLDVVTRYGVRYPHVSFICRRISTGRAKTVDLKTNGNSTSLQVISAVYGQALTNQTFSLDLDLQHVHAKLHVIASTLNYTMKKQHFILFINARLVDCQPFKKAISASYAPFIPKQTHPFVYISLQMKQQDIDVNVHPAKKEVRFLHEQDIVDAVVEVLNQKLKGAETSRTFLTQSLLVSNAPMEQVEPAKRADSPSTRKDAEERELRRQKLLSDDSKKGVNISDLFEMGAVESGSERLAQREETDALPTRKRSKQYYFSSHNGALTSRPSSSGSVYSKDKVRTGADAPVGLMDRFINRSEHHSLTRIDSSRKRSKNALPLLTSIENLLADCKKNSHKGLTQLVKEHQFVGIASEKFALIQHGTKLLLAELTVLVEELMYQQVLLRFGDVDTIKLDPPAPVKLLIDCFLTYLPDTTETRVDCESCATILMGKADMLREYFGISITGNAIDDLVLSEIPCLFAGSSPDVTFVGEFLYKLSATTDWRQEKPCFNSVARTISAFYGLHWESISSDARGNHSNEDAAKKVLERREWIIQHVFFAAMRVDFFVPRRFFTDNIIREITSTSRLYKIFERC